MTLGHERAPTPTATVPPSPATRTAALARAQARALLALVVVSLGLTALLERALGSVFRWDPDVIREAIEETGALASVIYVAAVIAAVVVPPLPSIPLDVAAGLAFGVWCGSLLTLAGDLIGAGIAFSIARRLGRPWLERRGVVARASSLADLAAGLTPGRLAGIRLLPTFSFELVSYAAGLSRMSLSAFLGATLIGVSGPVVLLVALGDALLRRPGLALATFGVLLLITVAPLAWWGWGPRREPPLGGGDADHSP